MQLIPTLAGISWNPEIRGILSVLMVGGDGSPRVGTPLVAGATVQAEVEQQFRGPKIVVFKYKPKKRYRRRTGHRQSLTRVAITAINA